MKHILTTLAAVLLAGAAMAQPDRLILTVTTGTNAAAAVTVTNSTIRGYIDEIKIDVPAAGTTGTVWLVAIPELSTLANVDLITKTNANADLTYRPRWDVTDVAGTALTEDGPEARMLVGDSVVFGVSNASATNITFKCIVKFDNGR